MSEYHYHPDGLVYFRNGGEVYSDTPDHADTDAGFAVPRPISGADEIRYLPGSGSIYLDRNGVVATDSATIPDLDAALADITSLLAAQASREALTKAAQTADRTQVLLWGYPNAVLGYSLKVDDFGSGVVITHWDAAAIGSPQPTEAEIDALEADWLVYRDTDEAKLDRFSLTKQQRWLLACGLKQHSDWLLWPAARRNKIQQVIDAGGDAIIDFLQS